MIKRPHSLDENKYVTKEAFSQFSNLVNNQFQKVLLKMTNIECLLQTLIENQRQQPSVQEFEIVDDQKYHQGLSNDHYDTEREVIEALDDDEMEIHIQEDNEETIYIQPQPKIRSVIRPIKKQYDPIRIDSPKAKKIKLEPDITEHEVEEIEYTEVEPNEHGRIETVETMETIVDEHTGEILKKMFGASSSHQQASSDINTFYNIPLPTPTITHLRALSSQLEEDLGALEKFKQFMQEVNTRNDGNFQKALSMIIADPVLFELNWLGFKGKNKMADMFIFQKLLYEEWFSSVDYDDYIANVKMVIKKAHKRYAKNQERRRARENQHSMTRDTLKEAVKTITVDFKPE